ncbi:hypothetical protein FRC07_013111, partial [Ceratobasidium sp. 392]
MTDRGYGNGPIIRPLIPATGGSFCDIWTGRLGTGEKVAIKCPRIFSIEANKDAKWHKVESKKLYKIELNRVGTDGCTGYADVVQAPSSERTQAVRAGAVPESACYSFSMDGKRDTTANNVLVSDEGIAKIKDFGMSAIFKNLPAFDNPTTFDGGSVRWMAPELIVRAGNGPSESLAGDVYALGMTLLEALTGKVPFHEHKLNP